MSGNKKISADHANAGMHRMLNRGEIRYNALLSGLKATLLCLVISVLVIASCTNYSSEPFLINPPIILDIRQENGGHVIEVAAQNTEIGLVGYTLYERASEEAAQEAEGVEITCATPLLDLPNRAIIYSLEVRTDRTMPLGEGARLCTLQTDLTSGNFVALRALVFENFATFRTSISSNAIQVP